MYLSLPTGNSPAAFDCMFLAGIIADIIYWIFQSLLFLVCNQFLGMWRTVSAPRRLDTTMELITYSFV